MWRGRNPVDERFPYLAILQGVAWRHAGCFLRGNMSERANLPTNPEELIAWAARADHSKRVLSLFLGTSREYIDEDVARALGRALRRVPSGRDLRREKDRKVVRAIRCLVDEVDLEDRRLRELFLRLRDAERRAGLG